MAAEAFVVPIHHGGAERPAYGTWASGPDYKVSFHDGMVFHPVRGSAAPRPHPFGWVTVEVAFGGQPLRKGEATFASDDWRAEYRFTGFVEAYDVKREGVEQSFVISTRPVDIGALKIVGEVRTDLVAPVTAAEHAAIVFHDALGVPVMSYGAAVAIDAIGKVYPMRSSFDGVHIELELPAVDVADAVFPLTVDPLMAAVPLETSTELLERGSIVHSEVDGRLVVVYTREVAAGSFDIYGRVFDTDFQNGTLVFADVDDQTSYTNPSVTMVGGSPARWVAAFEAEITGDAMPFRIAYHHQDISDLTLSSTVTLLAQAAGSSRRNPSVGGVVETESTATCLIVCEEEGTDADNANTPATGIRGILLDTSTDLATEVLDLVAPAGSLDREQPDVNQKMTESATESWVVVWQETDGSVTGDDWDVRAAKVSAAGVVAFDGAETLGEIAVARHNVRPRVDGRGGRYLVTYSSLTNTGGPSSATASMLLRAHQFDWPMGAPAPTGAAEFAVRASISNETFNTDLTFHRGTNGHWACLSDVLSVGLGGGLFVDRMNKSGLVESAAVSMAFQTSTPYGITYDSDNGSFAFVYSEPNSAPLIGGRMLLPSPPPPTYIGQGCGVPAPALIHRLGNALAGSQNLKIQMTNAAPNSGAALFISRTSVITPLDAAGFPGCALAIDTGPPFIVSVPGFTDAAGVRTVNFFIPPALTGTILFQFAYVIPTSPSNPLGLTKAMQVTFTL